MWPPQRKTLEPWLRPDNTLGAFHFLPPGHHLYLPMGRRGWGCPEKTLPALCSLPAQWTQHCPVLVSPPHLAPVWLYSADLAKGGRTQDLKEG